VTNTKNCRAGEGVKEEEEEKKKEEDVHPYTSRKSAKVTKRL